MKTTAYKTKESVEERRIHVADRLIDFDQWICNGTKTDFRELVDGILVEKPMVQFEHEMAESWLRFLLYGYVKGRGLGIVFGSRMPLRINSFRGRLPDIFFVPQQNIQTIASKAVYGAPDLVVEVVSPNDRPSTLRALETDYRNIGVKEIVFVDLPKLSVRILRQRGTDYIEDVLTEGELHLETIENIALRAEWLLHYPRPDEFEILNRWLEQVGSKDAIRKQGN